MPTRREVFQIAGATVVLGAVADAAPNPPPKPIAAGAHTVRDVPFKPEKLRGISQAMIASHHDNNYAGAVKNLNKVELELAKVDMSTPAFQVFALRERELNYANSKILHEAYFENLGGDGKRAGAIDKRLAAQFGTAARWEELFRATALSLGGGSGWVILDLNYATGDLRIYGTSDHKQAIAFGQPLLVLDMFEHAYAIDYGSGHGKYIDAFFQNIAWSEVDKRLARGDKALAALRA
jgi:Fe-Mn family superoxide dismutase